GPGGEDAFLAANAIAVRPAPLRPGLTPSRLTAQVLLRQLVDLGRIDVFAIEPSIVVYSQSHEDEGEDSDHEDINGAAATGTVGRNWHTTTSGILMHPRSQTPFGNASRETPFPETFDADRELRSRLQPIRETEFPDVRSQTEFGNEVVSVVVSYEQPSSHPWP